MKKLIVLLILLFAVPSIVVANDRVGWGITPGNNAPFLITQIELFHDPDGIEGVVTITGDEVSLGTMPITDVVHFLDFVGDASIGTFYLEITWDSVEVERSNGKSSSAWESVVLEYLTRRPLP